MRVGTCYQTHIYKIKAKEIIRAKIDFNIYLNTLMQRLNYSIIRKVKTSFRVLNTRVEFCSNI